MSRRAKNSEFEFSRKGFGGRTIVVIGSFILLAIALFSAGCIEGDPEDIRPVRPYDVDFLGHSIPGSLVSNSFYSIKIDLINKGSESWNPDGEEPVRLSYHWLKEGDLVLLDGYRTELPSEVWPGENLEILVIVKTPSEPGRHTLVIDPVKEGVTWFEEGGSRPLVLNVTIEEIPFIDGLDYECQYGSINELEELIEGTLRSSATSFEGRSGRVYGFFAGSGYPQIWVRDSATIIPTARFFYGDALIKTWIEEFLFYQAESGSVYDFVSPTVRDKNTVETDQETSLVHSAYQYYRISGDEDWLNKDVNGRTVISRLDMSLRYLLDYKYNSTYSLIEGAYTADWGDVQFEDQLGTDITNESHMNCDIYDNSMFYKACNELSIMYSASDDQENAAFWSETAESIRDNANLHLWDEDRVYYRVRVPMLSFDFEEEDIFPMGGNAVAVQSRLANETQASKIFKNAVERKEMINSTTIGCVLNPPYPEGFFANPIMDEEYEYQNGGQWDWFAGRLILAKFENGFSEDAILHLEEISAQNLRSGGLFEWYTLEGEGRGSGDFAGSAGVLGQAIIEGYFGVYLSQDRLEMKPRLGVQNGSISLFEPSTALKVSYDYGVAQKSIIFFNYDSNVQNSYNISLRIPGGKYASEVLLDDLPVRFETLKNGDDRYVTFSGYPGSHKAVIELVQSYEMSEKLEVQ
jgi:hypothetical protein